MGFRRASLKLAVIVWDRLRKYFRAPTRDMAFRLFDHRRIGDQLPPGYRLVTVQEVVDHPEALKRAMPGVEVARVYLGTVFGLELGGHTELELHEVSHSLATIGYMHYDPLYVSTKHDPMQDSNALGTWPRMTFKLFSKDSQLPQGFSYATIQEVHDHPQALRRAMPGQEIANLVDGSVDGFEHGCNTRLERRNDVGYNLAKLDPMIGPKLHDPLYDSRKRNPKLTFKLYPIDDQLPLGCHHATVQEVLNHLEALRRAMPNWEIANLVDGSVDGFKYGCNIRLERRNDVGFNLATLDPMIGPMPHDPLLYVSREQNPMQESNASKIQPKLTFKLHPIDDQLPLGCHYATIEEVLNHPEALRRAMPGWELANLADGSVDGLKYGGYIRSEWRHDVDHYLVGSKMTFELVPINEEIPPGYGLVTVREFHEHRRSLLEPRGRTTNIKGKTINLVDGSIDKHRSRTRLERCNDAEYYLVTKSENRDGHLRCSGDYISCNVCTCIVNSCTSSTSPEYFSPRIAKLKEHMNRPGIDKVEAEIEASKDHWTETTSPLHVEASTSERPSGVLGVPDEQLFENLLKSREWESKTNEQVFGCLMQREWNSFTSKGTRPEVQANLNYHLLKEDWSRSFARMDGSTALDDKPCARGGQADIFLEKQVTEDSDSILERHALKVFRNRKELLDLLRDEIPRGVLKQNVVIGGMPSGRSCRHRCNVKQILLLNDGRLAFRMPLYGGDLRKFIDERKMLNNNCPPFSDDIATLLMLQIAMAMEDLHNDGIIHNDLKASNVLISNTLTLHGSSLVTREYPLFCWVADYECSIGTWGTGFWRAPEILHYVKHMDELDELDELRLDPTKASDVYSYGMTCYEIVTGLIPFEYEGHELDAYEVVLRGDTPKLPSNIKPWIKALLKQCWHQTPSARPTFEGIVKSILKNEPASEGIYMNFINGSY